MQSAKINQSLLALLRVIQNLAEVQGRPGQKAHVPFRDSNLTRLLQPCLGGNSKTAIVATVSPAYSSIDNTRATLNFISVAAKVCSIACSIACAIAYAAEFPASVVVHNYWH
jgi:centromeric protein E